MDLILKGVKSIKIYLIIFKMRLKYSRNCFYKLKKLDLYSQTVSLRITRSKEGGSSDRSVGSFFGVIMTIVSCAMITFFFVNEILLVLGYENVTYNSIQKANSNN